MPRDSDGLVFSTDGSHLRACSDCGQDPCVCPGDEDVVPGKTVLRLRLDRKGRGGKTVTVIDELPRNLKYFESLTRKLKSHCGTGGAYKDGVVEIQGDQRDKVQAFLERLGFRVRRSGG